MPTHVVYVGEPYDSTVSSNHDGAAGAFWGDWGFVGIYNTQTNTHAATYSYGTVSHEGLIHGVTIYTPKDTAGGFFQLESYEYPTHIKFEPSSSSSNCWFENRDEDSPLNGSIYLSGPDGSAQRLITHVSLAPFIWGDGRPREDARLRFNATGYDIPNGADLKGKQLSLFLVGRGLLIRNQAKVTLTTAYSYTPCGAPGSVTVPEYGAPDSLVAISWSEGTAGIENSITGYEVQRRDSVNGIDSQDPPHVTPGTYVDSEWGSWSTIATTANADTRQINITPNATRGKYSQFRVRTCGTAGAGFYSGWTLSTPILTNILPNDPSGVSATPSLWEAGNITVGWTQASAVTGNCGVTGYEIGILFNGNITSVTTESGASGSSSVSYTAAMPSINRGEQVKFGVRTVDALNETSDWVWSGYVKRNSRPMQATGLSASPVIYESTSSVSSITVSWTAATDPDGNLAGYIIRYSVSSNGNTWGNWAVLGNSESSPVTGTSYMHSPNETVLPRGSYIRYQVTSIDSLGAVGDSVVSNSVRRNRLPLTPSFVLPVLETGETLESLDPAIKVSFSADPDGQTQYVCIVLEKNSTVVWSGTRNVGSSAGTACFRFHVETEGVYTVTVWMSDGYGNSSEIEMEIELVAPSWTRSISSGTVISNASISHKADITEMVEKANAKRMAYGLAEFTKVESNGKVVKVNGVDLTIANANGYFAYWKPIMDTITAKMKECYTAVDETPPTVSITSQYPNAAVVNAVRDLIAGA